MIAMRRVLVLACFLFVGASDVRAQNPSVDEVLWWLPEDTETVIVARGPFTWKSVDGDTLPERLEPYFHELMFTAVTFGDRKSRELVIGSRVVLAVHSARNFRAPNSLGLGPYEGCDVIVFDSEFAKEREGLLKRFAARAVRTQIMSGHQVFVAQERLEDNEWITYIANPKPNILLIATHEAYLADVLRRMSARGSTRALPDSLPEWREVDQNAPLLAIRHFKRGSEEDSSSPFGG